MLKKEIVMCFSSNSAHFVMALVSKQLYGLEHEAITLWLPWVLKSFKCLFFQGNDLYVPFLLMYTVIFSIMHL